MVRLSNGRSLVNIDLTGKKALVTGGAVGIGRSIALRLAECGADIALTSWIHDSSEVRARLEAYGVRVFTARADLTSSADANQVVAAAADALGGRIDFLVNSVGGLVGRVPVKDMEDSHWHQVLDLNLSTVFYCSRAVLPFMTSPGGRIVSVSSLAAHTGGGAGAVAYGASKAGVLGFTRGLAKELGPEGITVNAVAPGLILDTPFHERFTPPDAQRRAIDEIPVGRPGQPIDVANAVVYLVSELGSFVNGEVIEINGGAWFA
jgi:3-oxoacyl-[acyl-carrier protein] reductase